MVDRAMHAKFIMKLKKRNWEKEHSDFEKEGFDNPLLVYRALKFHGGDHKAAKLWLVANKDSWNEDDHKQKRRKAKGKC